MTFTNSLLIIILLLEPFQFRQGYRGKRIESTVVDRLSQVVGLPEETRLSVIFRVSVSTYLVLVVVTEVRKIMRVSR